MNVEGIKSLIDSYAHLKQGWNSYDASPIKEGHVSTDNMSVVLGGRRVIKIHHITPDIAKALLSEDVYCAAKWNEDATTPNGRQYNERSIDEWALYILNYATEAAQQTTRGDEEAALHTIRKITNMGVNAMKQHGAPLREES